MDEFYCICFFIIGYFNVFFFLNSCCKILGKIQKEYVFLKNSILYQFWVAAGTNCHRFIGLNSINKIPYSSVGLKSKLGFTKLNPRCGQDCFLSWRLPGFRRLPWFCGSGLPVFEFLLLHHWHSSAHIVQVRTSLVEPAWSPSVSPPAVHWACPILVPFVKDGPDLVSSSSWNLEWFPFSWFSYSFIKDWSDLHQQFKLKSITFSFWVKFFFPI